MSGQKQAATKRDRVRLSDIEKSQARAAAMDRKFEPEDDKLLNYLRTAKNEVQGLRLIHFHLSLLKERDASYQTLARTALNELSQKASTLQIFSISNGDVIVIYKGLKLSSVTEICQKIEDLFLARTSMTANNPNNEASLYSIMELALHFITIIRFVEDLHQGGSATSDSAPVQPITLAELDKLEQSMRMFDLSPFLFNQPIVEIGAADQDEAAYYELYISVKLLQQRLCPDYDLTANKWLFNYFSSNLDQSVLKALKQDLSFMRGRAIGININLSSVISTAFIKFDESLPLDFRGRVVLEINKGDLIENMGLFTEVVEYAREREYLIGVDGLTPFLLLDLDLARLDIDYAKVFWSPELQELDPVQHDFLKQRVQEAEDFRFILARCDSVGSLLFAWEAGFTLVQGRAVDNIRRKGVSVREAIQTASSMETRRSARPARSA